jgi:membrane fusion protein (multidrug efflux system)
MNARVTQPAQGEAQIVKLPASEAPNRGVEAPAALKPVEAAASQPPKKKGSKRLIAMIAVPLILVIGGGYFYLNGGRYEDTDNANVQQPIVSVSPDISGRITEIDVKENQYVKAGDTLFKMDPAPFRIALDQANAALASARLNVEQLRVNYATSQTKLGTDQQTVVIQQRAQDRNNDLATKGVTTAATVDQGLLALQQAQQSVALDQQAVQGALAALDANVNLKTDDHPAVKMALAAVESAQRNLTKTTVTAPGPGVISQIPIFNVGQYVAAGTTIVSLVETDSSWVEANFKETQIETIKTGQPVTVVLDSYPGTKLHGTVQSLGAATGAEFSLIPPQNATGNWVKVVQRVPVRIDFSGNPDQPLRSGMSAEVTVDTGKTQLDKMMNH